MATRPCLISACRNQPTFADGVDAVLGEDRGARGRAGPSSRAGRDRALERLEVRLRLRHLRPRRGGATGATRAAAGAGRGRGRASFSARAGDCVRARVSLSKRSHVLSRCRTAVESEPRQHPPQLLSLVQCVYEVATAPRRLHCARVRQYVAAKPDQPRQAGHARRPQT